MALPGNVSTGTVVARFVDSAGDPPTGTVTFTPSYDRVKNVTASPAPTSILPKPITATLVAGAISQVLVATDDPDNNPSGWTYLASFAFGGGLQLASFSFALPSSTTVDLTVVSPVGTSGGATIIARGVPVGGTVGQVLVKGSTTDYDTDWDDVPGGAWGSITGTLSAQTDLNTALGLKATTAALAAEAVLARDADNLTSGTVADARVASTIARDSEVTSAVAAEATLARNGDNITSGTVADARIASTIARDSEVTAITDLKRNLRSTRNTQTGTAYTLVITDEDKIADISNSGTHTLTVPLNSSVAFPTGTRIGIYRRGAGDVVVAPAGGVTIEAPGGQLSLPLRYDTAWLTKRATDIWSLEINPDLSALASDSDLASAIAGLATVASSGDYDDLSNTPTLPISRSDEVASPITLTVVTPTDLTMLNTLGVGTYDIECLISFTGDSTDDSKFRLLFSGTATCMLKIVASRTAWAGSSATGMSIEEGAQKLGVQTTFDTTVTAIGSAANPGLIHWCGRVYVTVAGNLTVNGGKSADANATDTVVAAGSYLTAVEVLTTP